MAFGDGTTSNNPGITTEMLTSLLSQGASRRYDPGVLAAQSSIIPDHYKLAGAFIDGSKKSYYTTEGSPFATTTASSTSTPPVKIPDAEFRKARSDIMLKLLEIERARCLAKPDSEERLDDLAGLAEADDLFLARIEQGLEKYLKLMFGTSVSGIAPGHSVTTLSGATAASLNDAIAQTGVYPQLYNLRQHQFSQNKDGSIRLMVEFSTGPSVM